MRKILFVLMMLVFISCENEKSVQSDLDKLKTERKVLTNQIDSLNSNILDLNSDVLSLSEKEKELGMIAEGKTPKYILKLHLKQSHFSLSIKKHISDAVNAIDFELPVDKDFYNAVEVGTKVVDEFRTGSFWLKGSFGDWEMTVKEKEIR